MGIRGINRINNNNTIPPPPTTPLTTNQAVGTKAATKMTITTTAKNMRKIMMINMLVMRIMHIMLSMMRMSRIILMPKTMVKDMVEIDTRTMNETSVLSIMIIKEDIRVILVEMNMTEIKDTLIEETTVGVEVIEEANLTEATEAEAEEIEETKLGMVTMTIKIEDAAEDIIVAEEEVIMIGTITKLLKVKIKDLEMIIINDMNIEEMNVEEVVGEEIVVTITETRKKLDAQSMPLGKRLKILNKVMNLTLNLKNGQQ